MKVDTSSEKELLQAALRFESQVLAQIYDLYSPELYRYAARLLGDPSLAEDCVADTFSRFLKALRARRGPKEFLRAYLYRIAHNWVVDYYRRTPDEIEFKDIHLENNENPEQEASLRIRQAQVREAISQLSPEQQQVIMLKYLEGWDNKDVAQILKKPVGAVKSLQHRALVRLQKILHNKENDMHEK